MKITIGSVKRLRLTDLESLDPVCVDIENFKPGQGKVTIECFGEAWSAYWGAMGNKTVQEFFIRCNIDYLANKLYRAGDPKTEIDYVALKEHVKKTILKQRRDKLIDFETARNWWEQVDGLERVEESESETDFLYQVFGSDWYECIPTKTHHDYEYLCRIVTAVQDAFCQIR